ncbi:MAG: hypothetical protein ACM3IH_03330 [Sphingobacteriales bacterium]
MNDSDGQSDATPLPELIMDNTPSSERGGVATPTRPLLSRKLLADHECKTFAFIGGDRPHFLFSTAEGWGRFYVTDTQVALCVEDGSRYIGDLVRNSKRP